MRRYWLLSVGATFLGALKKSNQFFSILNRNDSPIAI